MFTIFKKIDKLKSLACSHLHKLFLNKQNKINGYIYVKGFIHLTKKTCSLKYFKRFI